MTSIFHTTNSKTVKSLKKKLKPMVETILEFEKAKEKLESNYLIRT